MRKKDEGLGYGFRVARCGLRAVPVDRLKYKIQLYNIVQKLFFKVIDEIKNDQQ